MAQLSLQDGIWNGTQLVPSRWIHESVEPWVQPTDQTNPNYAYGLLWWLPPNDSPIYKWWGFGGQFVYVLPNSNVGIVITSDTKKDYPELNGDDFLSRFVIPAIER